VGKALSISDPLRQVHQVLSVEHAGELPLEPDLIDQYLLLLEGVEQIGDVLTEDRLSGNVLLRIDNNSSAEIVEVGRWVDRWWAENGVEGFESSTTGIMYEFARSQDEIATGGIRGLLLAVATIGGLLLLIFRRLSLALLALIPNAVPIGIAFGLIGLAGIPLDAATVCLASLALGIAVDDTIHVITGFWDERALGRTPHEALDACFRRVLPALVFTTATIALGFGVLGISEFSLVRNLGLMTSGVVMLCLLADVLLLPALLLLSGSGSAAD
jgi:predicted RND superfamily exporter protein